MYRNFSLYQPYMKIKIKLMRISYEVSLTLVLQNNFKQDSKEQLRG